MSIWGAGRNLLFSPGRCDQPSFAGQPRRSRPESTSEPGASCLVGRRDLRSTTTSTCFALSTTTSEAVTPRRTRATPISNPTAACNIPTARRSACAGSCFNLANANDTAVTPISRSANARSIPTIARYARAGACDTTTAPYAHPTDARSGLSGACSPVTTDISGPTNDQYTRVRPLFRQNHSLRGVNQPDLSCDHSLLRPNRHFPWTILSPKVDTRHAAPRSLTNRRTVRHNREVWPRYSLSDNDIHRHATTPSCLARCVARHTVRSSLCSHGTARCPGCQAASPRERRRGPQEPAPVQIPKGVAVC